MLMDAPADCAIDGHRRGPNRSHRQLSIITHRAHDADNVAGLKTIRREVAAQRRNRFRSGIEGDICTDARLHSGRHFAIGTRARHK